MLLPLALLLQTVTLDADPAKAAATCAEAGGRLALEDHSTRATGEVIYYLLQSVRVGDTEHFMDRFQQMTSAPHSGPRLERGRAAMTLEACRQRFPKAQAAGPVHLPTDPFRRDVMCFGALNLLGGAEEYFSKQTGDRTQLDRIVSLLDKIKGRMSGERFVAAGFGSAEGQRRIVVEELIAMLEIGPPDAIVDRCAIEIGD